MKLAPLSDMWDQYPTGVPATVASLVGGPVGDHIVNDHWETCCIRCSRALNYSARPVTDFAKMANKYMDGKDPKVRASKGGDDNWYIYSCYDLRVYLENRFGQPKRFGSYEKSDLSSIKGIIMFAFRHCDLWNGSEVRYNTDFTDGTKTVSEICIWEAPD